MRTLSGFLRRFAKTFPKSRKESSSCPNQGKGAQKGKPIQIKKEENICVI
jgi:hypothetical protein